MYCKHEQGTFFPTVAMTVHRRARWIPLTSAAVEVQTDALLQPVIWGLFHCLMSFFLVKELSFVYIANHVPKGNEFGILTKIKKESHSRTSLKRPQVKYMVKALVWSQLSIYPSLYAAERLSSDAA